MKMSIFVRDYD